MSTNNKQELIIKLRKNIVQLVKNYKKLSSEKNMRVKLFYSIYTTTNEYANLLQHLLEESQKNFRTYYQLLELLKIMICHRDKDFFLFFCGYACRFDKQRK